MKYLDTHHTLQQGWILFFSFFIKAIVSNMTELELLNKLGTKIKTIRLQKKISQMALAEQCDFPKASMSRIESGYTNPTVKTLIKISRALNVKLADLFSD